MGRRKIEIKAIKDDRNRSVYAHLRPSFCASLTPYRRTFLKRKGGLFKKAHELSVLCSVDVAVVIFGQNKKLYEFSSGDINQTLQRYSYVSAPLSQCAIVSSHIIAVWPTTRAQRSR